MALGVVESRHLTDIANAIRTQNGINADYTPYGMKVAVERLDGTRGPYKGQAQYKGRPAGKVHDWILEGIADAIRGHNGLDKRYRVDEMAQAILDLTWGE